MQVEAIRTYTAKQPDELSLQVADVVLVSQTVEDSTLASDASAAFSLTFLNVPPISHLPVLTIWFHHAFSSTVLFSTYLFHIKNYLFKDVLINLCKHTLLAFKKKQRWLSKAE